MKYTPIFMILPIMYFIWQAVVLRVQIEICFFFFFFGRDWIVYRSLVK